jgi:hypothetical protein
MSKGVRQAILGLTRKYCTFTNCVCLAYICTTFQISCIPIKPQLQYNRLEVDNVIDIKVFPCQYSCGTIGTKIMHFVHLLVFKQTNGNHQNIWQMF